jgi:hypothetical protein
MIETNDRRKMPQRIAVTAGTTIVAVALALTLPLGGVFAPAAAAQVRAHVEAISHTQSERQFLIETCRGAAKGAILLKVEDLITGVVYACWGANNPANWSTTTTK